METLAFSLILITMGLVLANAQNVEIPDTAFLHALIDEGVDTDGDSSISNEEAEGILSLNVDERNISDLKGIEAFINLDSVSCDQNNISKLDLSNNIALTFLSCKRNQIAEPDLKM